jgi:hypothetical protein
MQSGVSADGAETRRLRIKDRMEEFQCTYCPPHRGENSRVHGKKNTRWVNGVRIKRKNKEQK